MSSDRAFALSDYTISRKWVSLELRRQSRVADPAVQQWLERKMREFSDELLKTCSAPGQATMMRVTADGTIKVELVDTLAASPGADPAAAAAGPELGEARADTSPLLPYWPLAHCGN